jgi:hypothetical protein
LTIDLLPGACEKAGEKGVNGFTFGYGEGRRKQDGSVDHSRHGLTKKRNPFCRYRNAGEAVPAMAEKEKLLENVLRLVRLQGSSIFL